MSSKMRPLISILIATAALSTPIKDRKQDDTRTLLALNHVLLHHSDFTAEDFASVSSVNKYLHDAVCEVQKWKYLDSVVSNKACLGKLFYGENHLAPPSERNSIKYLHVFNFWSRPYHSPDGYYYVRHVLNTNVTASIHCLDLLVAQTPHLEIVTCEDGRFTEFEQCEVDKAFRNQLILWQPEIEDSIVTYFPEPTDANNLAKRILLFGAILHRRYNLVNFLLDHSQTMTVEREDLAAALYIGHEELFVRMFRSNGPHTRQMLAAEVPVSEDMAVFAAMSPTPVSNHVFDFLFSYVVPTNVHIVAAASADNVDLVSYIVSKIKSIAADTDDVDVTISKAIFSIVLSGNLTVLSLLLDEITNVGVLNTENAQYLLSRGIAQTKGDHVKEILEVFSRKLDMTIYLPAFVNQDWRLH